MAIGVCRLCGIQLQLFELRAEFDAAGAVKSRICDNRFGCRVRRKAKKLAEARKGKT
jgi:hypothetical protein